MTKKTKSTEAETVLIVTSTRPWSIVVGEVESSDEQWTVLRNARMVAYFSADAKTVLGAAVNGPGKQARVAPAVEKWRTRTALIEHWAAVTPEAAKAFEAEPWT